MRVLNQVNGIFVDRKNGQEVRIVEVDYPLSSEPLVTFEYLLNGASGRLGQQIFEDHYMPRNEKAKKSKKNINSDILKLIEAGYEFSSFFGDTLDGRSISVDLNEEENQ